MLFTTGNLITLGIVAVALILYRQIDRGNRSLEKVKKYGDKLRDDLDVYVDKRAEDLQRFGIELDVQQKAAKEILKRLQMVEEGLSARAESIGGIEKRLAEYDSALARLMEMTARVDENLVRIQDESSFTEQVAKKIEAAKRELSVLEDELPALKDAFRRENSETLVAFKESILAETGTRLTETESRLERAAAEAAAALERAETAKREADKEFQRAFERARGEAEKLEDAAFEKLRAASEVKAGRLKETVEEKFAQIGQNAKEKAAETQTLIKNLKAEWKAEADGLLGATRAEIGRAAEDLGSRLDAAETKSAAIEAEVDRRFLGVEKKTEELAHALAEKAKNLITAQREDFERKAGEAKTAAAAQLEELGRSVSAAREGAAQAGKELAAVLASAQAEANRIAERVSQEGEAAALKALEGVERRLGEYGSEIEAKFARLETVNADIGALETALRAAMAESERRIEGDFANFGSNLEAERGRFEKDFLEKTAVLTNRMESLEAELAALKTRAYENVSEKLKIFEDEFFTDLKTRREASEATLQGWKADLDRELGEISSRAEAERTEAEKAGLEELRAHMAETQARVYEQLETIRQRAEAVQDGIRAQAGMAEEALAALRETVRQEAAEARKTAEAHVEGEIARFTLESDARLKAAERKAEEGIAALAAEISAEEMRIKETRDATAAAAEEFRSGFAAALAEADGKVRADFEAWKKGTTALLESLKADYETQRDGYMGQAREQRDGIQKELTSLADRTAELRQDLSARISQALESFSRGYESFLGDIGKRQKEVQAETEAKLRDFRDAAQDLVLKIEGSRAQALGKVESEALRLSQSLAEIDKEQKAFIAQTKVFDRADELAAKLAASIESMQTDIGHLDTRRAEITEIENQLSRVKRLEDEVNQKVTRFLAEKRRIDALEEDFGRLAAVAQGVDKKLEEVTGESDALTEAQARIRKLLELSAEAETKYERLEKKAQVLDTTAEAVDKNFQGVQNLEKLLVALGAEAKRLPERIAQIKASVDELAAGKPRLDEAVEKLDSLDGIIKDTEKRIAESQKAREWLARAETRLEEVNRQAQEQLKLLSTLLKEEGADKKGRGAPPNSVQETVRKLARQGWSADEIARAVKISRGEVELILELGGKA